MSHAVIPTPSEARGRDLPQVVAGVCTLVAAVAILGTYSVYNGTFDEPAHIAAGLEYLDRGRYTYEPMHPPLARLAMAAGPYLAGVRSTGAETMWREGRNVLYGSGTYRRNLALARVGILPFFLLATLVVWAWARHLSGDWAAAAAVGLFVTSQPVLAHAGLATLDMAMTATCGAALLRFTLWLDRNSRTRSLLLGTAAGAAVMAKFSALVFLPAAAIAILAIRWWKGPTISATGLPLPRAIAWTAAAGALVIWAGYRFSFAPVTSGFPVPAPELWRGLSEVLGHNRVGWESYLLGEVSTTGWWYYFPVALAVKTPLPLFLLTGVGIAAADMTSRLAPAVSALAILLAGMIWAPAIGLRQILPIYVPLAVISGCGAVALWQWSGRARVAQAFASVLLAWQLMGAARAYPDFLPWFNALAGPRPDRVLVTGDLDWGQDLFRLVDTTRARQVDSLTLAYFGSADPELHFAHARPWAPFERPAGWAAVSLAVIKGLSVPGGHGFEWLDSIPPVATAGTSIRLYHFPAP